MFVILFSVADCPQLGQNFLAISVLQFLQFVIFNVYSVLKEPVVVIVAKVTDFEGFEFEIRLTIGNAYTKCGCKIIKKTFRIGSAPNQSGGVL